MSESEDDSSSTVTDESAGVVSSPGAAAFDRLVDWDRRTSERLAVCSGPDAPWGRAREWLRLIEYTGDGLPWLVGVWFSVLVSDDVSKRDGRLNLLCLLVFDLVVLLTCKAVVRRDRPAYNIKDHTTLLSDIYSFPSGHATRAVTVAIFMVREFDCGLAYIVLLLVWVVMCCASRVLLGRHHVLDVFAGMIVGVLEYLVFKRFLWLTPEICESIMKYAIIKLKA